MDLPSLTELLRRLDELNRIGVSLSKEKDIDSLLDTILLAAKTIAHADGGTLYRVQDGQLHFKILRNDTLNLVMGGPSGVPIGFEPLPLHDAQGRPNHSLVVAYAALRDVTVNIADAYSAAGFDFSGTREFDKKTGYRSKSFLAVPMKDHQEQIIGVLQLINAKHPHSGEIVAFSEADQRLAESLASQAAIAITNRMLINQLENLFESFISLINAAIDDKSPYTGGHCERVPVLTMMLAEAVNRTAVGPLKDFRMSEMDLHELKIAGLLHDCGKVTTPVHVVDKATKLQTLFDRIHLLETRCEVLKRDVEIESLKQQLAALGSAEPALAGRQRLEQKLARIDADFEFLRGCNIGSEKMPEADQQRVREIARRYSWRNENGEVAPFLSEEEVRNLTIGSGTLTPEERQIINHHIEVTIQMLESLPWPKHLKNVPEYAGGHHERMDGNGYPRGLTREQMSVQARMMGIADIFEALTARDRPYKKGKTLSEALHILGKFKLNGHVDPDLFDVFVREKVYLRYGRQFLDAQQVDAVDESSIPGYRQ